MQPAPTFKLFFTMLSSAKYNLAVANYAIKCLKHFVVIKQVYSYSFITLIERHSKRWLPVNYSVQIGKGYKNCEPATK